MTLVEAVAIVGWPPGPSRRGGASAEQAWALLLSEARRQGSKQRFQPDVVDQAVSDFMMRFWRLRKKPAFSSDSAVSGYVYNAVFNNCLTIIRSRGTQSLFEDGIQRHGGTSEPTTHPVDERLGPHEDAAREELPTLMRCVGDRLGTLDFETKIRKGVPQNPEAFREILERIANNSWPGDEADKRAYDRAFRVMRVLLPDCCLNRGLAPADVVEFLGQLKSLKAQSEFLWHDECALRDDLSPRVPWFFAVAAKWQERCLGETREWRNR